MIMLTYSDAAIFMVLLFVALCWGRHQRLCNRELKSQLNYCLRFIRRNYPRYEPVETTEPETTCKP